MDIIINSFDENNIHMTSLFLRLTPYSWRASFVLLHLLPSFLLSPPITHPSFRPPPLHSSPSRASPHTAHRFAHRLLRYHDQRFSGGGDPSSGRRHRRRRWRGRRLWERHRAEKPSGRQCHHPDIIHGSTESQPEPSQQQQRCRPEPHVLRGPEHLLPGAEHPDADL